MKQADQELLIMVRAHLKYLRGKKQITKEQHDNALKDIETNLKTKEEI